MVRAKVVIGLVVYASLMLLSVVAQDRVRSRYLQEVTTPMPAIPAGTSPVQAQSIVAAQAAGRSNTLYQWASWQHRTSASLLIAQSMATMAFFAWLAYTASCCRSKVPPQSPSPSTPSGGANG